MNKKNAVFHLRAALLLGCSILVLHSHGVYAQSESKSDTLSTAPVEITADTVKEQAAKNVTSLLQSEMVDDKESRFLHALVTTYEHNPELRAAREAVRAIFENLAQADAGWRPTISGSANAEYAHQNTDPGASDDRTERAGSITLEQALYRGGRTLAEISTAKNQIRAAIADLEDLEQRVLLQAITSYLDFIRDEALFKLSQNNEHVIAEQLRATEQRFEVGELTRTDVSQAEARLARAQADVIAARGNFESSTAIFHKIIGYAPLDLKFPVVNIPAPISLEEAIKYAENWNPEVRASISSHKSSEAAVSTVAGNLLPEISLQSSVNKSYDVSTSIDSSDSATVGVVATIPLYEAGSVRSQVRQAKHVANQRYVEVINSKRTVREMVVSAWEDLAAARAEIDARTKQLQAAEVARFGVKQEAELGTRTVLDTLDADQEVMDAQTALVIARRNEVVAHYALAASMGVLNPVTLGFSEKIPNYDREIQAVRQNLFGLDVDRVSP